MLIITPYLYSVILFFIFTYFSTIQYFFYQKMGNDSCSCVKQAQLSSSSNYFSLSIGDPQNSTNFPEPTQLQEEQFDNSSKLKLNNRFLNTQIVASNNKLLFQTMSSVEDNNDQIMMLSLNKFETKFFDSAGLSQSIGIKQDSHDENQTDNEKEPQEKKRKKRKSSIQTIIKCDFKELSVQSTEKEIMESLHHYILSEKHMYEPVRIKKQTFIKFKNIQISKNYSFLEKIGQGTYGNVYKAKNKHTGQLRAIKVLKKSKINRIDNKKIMQQLQILKKIDHPYILKIFEAYILQDQYCIVTEYCQGGPLAQYVRQNRAFSQKSLKLIFRKIFSALAYLHKLNIVHRDIKLDNILLVSKLDSKKDIQILDIRIIDFGLAKILSQNRVKDKVKIGTHTYMAPEAIVGIYSTKCDVWGCGILLINLLTHFNPFKGKDKQETFLNIQTKQLNFAGWQWKYIDYKAKDLLLKLLNKNNLLRITMSEALKHPWLTIQDNIHEQKHIFQKFTKKLYEYHRGNSLVFFIQSFLSFTSTQPNQKIQISKIFELLDKNCDGYIQREEIEYAFKQSNKEMDEHQKNYILSIIDKNHSGKLYYSDLVAILSDKKKLFVKQAMISAFKYIDIDNSGFIQKNELRQLLKSANIKELQSILQQLDQNNDKQISEEQFIKYLEEKLQNA